MSENHEEGLITAIKRFKSLFAQDKPELYQIYIYAVFTGLLSLVLPFGIQTIINLIQTGRTSSSWYFVVILVTGSVILSGVLQVMQLRIVERLQQKIFFRSAVEFTYRIPKLNLSKISHSYPPELVNRFFDVLTVQKGMSKILIDMTTAALQIIFGLVLLSFYNNFFIVFSFILLFLLYWALRNTSFRGFSTAYEESSHKYKMASWLQDIAKSLAWFKVFSKADYHLKRTDEITYNYIQARERHFKIIVRQFIQLIGFKVIITMSLLLIGGLLVIRGQMNIGQFIASEIIILLVISSVEKLIMGLDTVYDVLVGIEKLGGFIDIELDHQAVDEKQEFNHEVEEEELDMRLQDVSYNSHFDNRVEISEINIALERKSRVAVVGGRQSGKSVFFSLIAGINSDYRGKILINGITKKNYKNASIFEKLAYCNSAHGIFSGSIKENILMGRHISDKRLFETCNNVQIIDFINNTENGFDTEILTDGKYLSQNIRLKILLARALVSYPKLLILEDFVDKLYLNGEFELLDYLFDPAKKWAIIAEIQHQELLKYFIDVTVFENSKMKLTTSVENFMEDPTINDYLYA